MRLLVIPTLSAIATYLLDRALDNRMDNEVRFGDFNILLQMQQRQLQLGKLLFGHRDAYAYAIDEYA